MFYNIHDITIIYNYDYYTIIFGTFSAKSVIIKIIIIFLIKYIIIYNYLERTIIMHANRQLIIYI